LEGWVDVMVSPKQLAFFDIFKPEVRVEDVQVQLDIHEAEQQQKRNRTNSVGFFDYFPTTGEVHGWLNEQITAHPNVARPVLVGYTYQGNEIFGLRLGSGSRVYYIHCTIHAREWITTTTCVYIIDQLLNIDPAGPALLAKFQWVIVPVFNVDGYDYTHTSDRLWRKNRQPNGGSCAGTDINRNYGYAWGGAGSSNNPCAETFRGATPWSSPEAAAERTFLTPVLDAGQLAVYFDIHSYGAYFMSSWGYTTTLPPAYAAMEQAMVSGVNAIWDVNGRTYTHGASSRVLYLTSGGTTDWVYGDYGLAHAYVIECFGSSFTPPATWIPTIGAEVYAGIKNLAQILN